MQDAAGKDGRSLTIGLLWHSVNSDNLGIGALTVSHIALIEEIASELHLSVSFVVIGWADSEEPYIVGDTIDFFPLSKGAFLSPRGLLARIRACDLVFDVSAGDSFADIYGQRRFFFNVLAKFVVLLAGKPLVLSPQTYGPFKRRWSLHAARFILKRARKVVTRDKLSLDYLRRFQLGNKVIQATDLAFRLPFEPVRQTAGTIHIGLNVSGLLFNGGYTRSNMFELKCDYAGLTRSLIEIFDKMEGCQVHLIGHVFSRFQEVEDDYRVIHRLGEDYPNAIVAPLFSSPSEAKSYIAGMDFFCGARMHACIAAFSAGVPTVAIAYSRKFEGLFSSLGYHHLADCSVMTHSEIVDQIMTAFENRQDIRQDVMACLSRVDEKYNNYRDIVRDLLANFN